MKRLITAGCLVLLFVSGGQTGDKDDEDDLRNVFYRGQIIDVDTGKPLEGVLVVFVWYRDVRPPASLYVQYELHAVTEVMTDGAGHFAISAAPEAAVGPFLLHVHSPEPVFFKPGHIRYQLRFQGDARKKPMLLYMKRVQDPQDAVDLRLDATFPYDRTPQLLKALNAERARLGLPAIQPSNGRGSQ